MDHPDTPPLTPARVPEQVDSSLQEVEMTPLDPETTAGEAPELDVGVEGQVSGETPSEDSEPALADEQKPPEPESPESPSRDANLTRLLVGAIVVVLLFVVGAAFLWKAHSDLGALRQEVAGLKAQSQRSQVVQQRGSILRVRAELQTLRQTLPAELSIDVDKAEALLVGVDERLKASR